MPEPKDKDAALPLLVNGPQPNGPQPFDFAKAVQKAHPGPHYRHDDPHGNLCLWLFSSRASFDFLLNVAAYDAFMALPCTGTKYIRLKGSRDNIDTMFPISQLRINPADTFDGKMGTAYRINPERNTTVAFSQPSTFIPF